MNYEILKNPMGLIEFTLNQGEKVTAEAAAMVYIRGNIKTETRMRKGEFLLDKLSCLDGFSFLEWGKNFFTLPSNGICMARIDITYALNHGITEVFHSGNSRIYILNNTHKISKLKRFFRWRLIILQLQ